MFRLEKPDDGSYVGEDIKSGSLRLRGKSEPLPNQGKLNPEEAEARKMNEELGLRELKFLEKFLEKNRKDGNEISAIEVLRDKGKRRYVENHLPSGFRFIKLEEHLKTLMGQGK